MGFFKQNKKNSLDLHILCSVKLFVYLYIFCTNIYGIDVNC